MGRPKKEKPNHGKYFEVKKTVGHKMDGTPIRKSFYSETSRADAEQRGERWAVAHEVAEQTGKPFLENDCTFAQCAREWLETDKKYDVNANTYKFTYKRNVEKHLFPYFGKSKISDIEETNIKDFFSSNSFLSESLLKKLHMCLYGIFEFGIDKGVCIKNPVKKVHVKSKRKKNEKHVYDDTQIEFVKKIAKVKMPEAYVILNSGVRREEVLGFKWADFHKGGKYISVNQSLSNVQDRDHWNDPDNVSPGIKEGPPKWNSYRDIPLEDECVAFINGLPRNGVYIFSNPDGSPQSPNAWSKRLKRFMIKVHEQNPSIPVLSAHELRHTFGTMLRRHGVDIYTIQKVLGHKSVEMTANIYVKNELDVLRKDMGIDKKTGTGVVQLSHGRKFKVKWIRKRPRE